MDLLIHAALPAPFFPGGPGRECAGNRSTQGSLACTGPVRLAGHRIAQGVKFVKRPICWVFEIVQTLDKPAAPTKDSAAMSKKGDGSLAWLRDRNRQRVMEVLRIQGRTSQSDIARATGLSRTTVHTVIGQLKESGVVVEVDGKRPEAGSGRPAVQLVLRNTSRAVLGIDFGHSHVQVAVADLAHNVLAERHRDLDVNHRATEALDSSAEMASEGLAEAGIDRMRGIGVGIGMPGPVARGQVTSAC